MAQTDSIIALDVSKDRLDGLDADTGEVFQVENSVSGRATLVRRCRGRTVQLGRWAKNDRLDGEMIAAYARVIPGSDRQVDPVEDRLAELATYRRGHAQPRHHGKRADPRSARLRRMKHSCLAAPAMAAGTGVRQD